MLDAPEQLELATVPFSNETTSLEAADFVRGHLHPQESAVISELVRCFYKGRGGCTFEELATATGLAENSVRPRVRGLVMRGRVVASPARRDSKAGRPCIVWAPTFSETPLEPAARQTHGRIVAALNRERETVLAHIEGLRAAAQSDAARDFAGQLIHWMHERSHTGGGR